MNSVNFALTEFSEARIVVNFPMNLLQGLLLYVASGAS
jgi:hypothetical protein